MKKIAMLLPMLLLVSGASFADVLVTTKGDRIETKGPWKVKGATVVFTSENGVLSSMRAREIDLEASEAATAEAANAKPVPRRTYSEGSQPKLPIPTEPPPEGALTITNKDVGTARSPVSAESIGMDLTGLDERAQSRVVQEIGYYSAALLRLHADHDLTTEKGVKASTPGLQSLAKRARSNVGAGGAILRPYFESLANEMEGWAKLAQSAPWQAAGEFAVFLNSVDRETADAGARAMQTEEGRREFERSLTEGGG